MTLKKFVALCLQANRAAVRAGAAELRAERLYIKYLAARAQQRVAKNREDDLKQAVRTAKEGIA